MGNPIILLTLGIAIGVFSGVMGLGGGALMIPIMVLAGIVESQTKAHGTSLAVMIPPVTLPAVIKYYREGQVDVGVALWMALGFACGAFFGAWIATSLPKEALKLVFGFVLIYVAGYTIFSWFGKEHLTRTVILAGVLALIATGLFAATKWHDARKATRTASTL